MSLSLAMRFMCFMHFKRRPEKRSGMISIWLANGSGIEILSADNDHAPVAGLPLFKATDPGIFMERGSAVELWKR